jgi:ABC-type transport system substrate-binding protein
MWSFQAPGAGWVPQFAQIISGYWDAVGVKTKISPIDNATLQGMLAANPIDPKIPGTSRPHPGATIPNNMYLLVNAYHSTGLGKALSDPAWDALYTNTLKELDETKRVAMWRDIMNKGHDQYVDVMAVNVKVVYAVSNKVGEWTAITTNIGGVYEGVKAK